MAPYLICFSITGIFALINEYSIQKKQRVIILFSAFFVIIVPAILAGMRSYYIGTDTNFYVVPSFNLARGFSSLTDWISVFGAPGITQNLERGFLLLIYFASRISTNAHIVLFLIALIEDIFVYLSLYKLRKHCNIFMGEMVFLLTLYNALFNMVRQGIAMAICLYAVAILLSNEKNKYLKFLLWIIIASQFHGTAIISLLILVIYLLFKNVQEGHTIRKIGLLVIMVLIVTMFVSSVQYLTSIGLIPMHYLEYLNGGAAYSNSKVSAIGLIIYSSSYLVLISGRKYLGNNAMFFIAIAFMDLGFMFMTNMSFYLYRIAYYFLFIRVFSLSQRTLYKMQPYRNIWNNSYVLWGESLFSVLMYFVYFILVSNWHETIPYIFMNN